MSDSLMFIIALVVQCMVWIFLGGAFYNQRKNDRAFMETLARRLTQLELRYQDRQDLHNSQLGSINSNISVISNDISSIKHSIAALPCYDHRSMISRNQERLSRIEGQQNKP